MRRFLALAVALVALVAAGFFWTRDTPVAIAVEAAPAPDTDDDDAPLVAPVSNVTPADREARRFGRYDKDKDAAVSREEYLVTRRKAYARLDKNGDGRLDFEEYATATVKKFTTADRDGDGALQVGEFASTAVKRREAPKCACEP